MRHPPCAVTLGKKRTSNHKESNEKSFTEESKLRTARISFVTETCRSLFYVVKEVEQAIAHIFFLWFRQNTVDSTFPPDRRLYPAYRRL